MFWERTSASRVTSGSDKRFIKIAGYFKHTLTQVHLPMNDFDDQFDDDFDEDFENEEELDEGFDDQVGEDEDFDEGADEEPVEDEGGYEDEDDEEDFDKPVSEGEVVEVEIDDLGSKGDGIARVEGFVVFVPGGEVGETYEVEVTSVGRKFAFAEIVE